MKLQSVTTTRCDDELTNSLSDRCGKWVATQSAHIKERRHDWNICVRVCVCVRLSAVFARRTDNNWGDTKDLRAVPIF